MKKFNFAAILIFIFFGGVFSQTNEISPCPKISVTGPSSVPKPNEPITFFASVGEDAEIYNVKYLWTVSNGKILEGQGTAFIKASRENPGISLTATVKVEGLPENCDNTFSESVHPGSPALPIIKIDEFEIPISKDNNVKNQSMIDALQNNPSAQLYVIIYLKNKTTQKTAIRKGQQILKFLTEKNEIARERITILKGVADKEQARFWIVPAGVTPPVPEN